MSVVEKEASFRYQEILGPTRTLGILLVFGALVAGMSFVSSSMQADLLRQPVIDPFDADANDRREQAIAIVQLVLFVVTVVVFGRWIVRAQKNVRALGAEGMTITPGWAVGYFFVPVVNLWKPYQAMRDLWCASRNPASWGPAEVGTLVPVWWFLWLASNIAGQVSFRLSMRAATFEEFQFLTEVQRIEAAVSVVLALTAWKMVSAIGQAQTRSKQQASVGLAM